MARITPAGAGKTFSSKRSNANCEDHPRRCGENLFVPDGQEIADGSPPQVRGKQLFTGKLNSNFRITPAGAGKTPPKARFIPLSQDHPRRCGENLIYCIVSGASAGITPAGAGKTECKQNRHYFNGDHPRRCGENALTKIHYDTEHGSPPQVRGKRPAAA